MQPRETESAVFGHKTVEQNGDTFIMPIDLDPHMKGRALTLLEARTIIAALTGLAIHELEIPEMFEPAVKQGPEVAPPHTGDPVSNDPSSLAYEAASSVDDLQRIMTATNEQFGLAA